MSLESLCNQNATIYPSTGTNEYGRETLGAGVAAKVRFQRVSKTRLMPNGENVSIAGIMYIPGDADIDTGYKVTYDGNDYKVFGIDTSIDGQGNVYMVKAQLMKWNI